MKSVVFGTAGHIDHGKSALVRALTGIDPDRLKEEKERGITIDLGFAHYEDAGLTIAFVDVPGHERFVKNMLAGASGIDLVLLVIAADESVMPQTREHFSICRLLGVRGGVIALTKADLVDGETLDLVRLETRDLVAGSFLEEAPIIAVSAKTGAGLMELRAALARLAHVTPARAPVGAVRLPVDRAFSVRGFGTIVTGTLVSGRVTEDVELELLPAGRRVKVRGVQVHGRAQAEALAGQRTALNLSGVDVAHVTRGNTLATPGCFEATRRFDVVFELLAGARSLRHGARVRFHQGTSEVLGRVALVSELTERDRRDERAGGASAGVQPGSRAYARLRLEAPAVVTRGDRFILRAYSPPVTIAGGYVLDPQPPRGGTRTPAVRRRFERLDTGPGGRDDLRSLEAAVGALVEERGVVGLRVRALASRAGVAPEAVEGMVQRLREGGQAVRAGEVLVAPAIVRALEARVLAELAAYHRQHPLEEGMPREEVRERLFGRADPGLFDQVLGELVAAGQIAARDRLALRAHQVALSPAEAQARDHIEEAFRDAGLKPPDLAALPALTGLGAGEVDRLVRLLLRQKTLVRVDTLVFHRDALQRLKDEVAAMKAATPQDAGLDVATFKERYGVTRKFAIPLLEYLDRERVTKRVGEVRLIL